MPAPDAPAPPLDPPPADAPPASSAAAGGWPTWARRALIAVVLGSTLALAAWGAGFTVSGGGDDHLDEAIIALFPRDGAQALRQTAIGADLQPGYDGRLQINGIDIPEDQMDGAIDPNSVTQAQLDRYGIRPNNKNHVFFTPGPGKVIEEYDTGVLTIVLRYFRDEREDATSRTVTWNVRVD
ncbi:MAG TPA: hypothetical protein P5254_13235 [Aquihabitans sp.]|nr:hypothetical protein [Aquihabitans sp.]